jgi:hypothetical protein
MHDSKCNSFFLKFQAKNKLKKIVNTKNILNEKESYAGIQPRIKQRPERNKKLLERYNF